MANQTRKVEISWIQGKDQGDAESNIAYYLDKAHQLKDVDLVVFRLDKAELKLSTVSSCKR